MADPPAAQLSLSLVADCGECAAPCGYCHSAEETSWSHGMQAEFLTPDAYQELLDR
jgi:molybdenum cofactor biosynthesis enzyme MoaA